MCTIWEEIEKKGREEGLAEGHTKGLAEGHTRGLAEGHTQGLAEGHAQGLLEGHTQGLLEGQARGIIDMGLEYGLSKNDILKQLQKKLKISAQEAKEYFEQFAEQLV
jgi:flagellar biosynthesis/type III secretory pathway protein FliH